jgi:hypothetical protein
MSNPIPNARELVEDRIKFKFYATEKHLSLLKDLQAKGVTLNNLEGRVKWEIEIENLLAHLIGAKDSLLGSINDKLQLDILPYLLKYKIQEELNKRDRSELLKDLNDLLENKDSWLSKLIDFRNTGMHNNILNVRHEVELKEDLNTGESSSGPMRIYFKDDPDSNLEVIPYLEERIQKMKQLIDNILSRI